jgi:hypothetical protein
LDSATGIQFVNPSVVIVASGDFASYVSPWISQATFIPSFNFNPLSPSPVNPLWAAGGFSFTMNAVQIVYQDNLQLNLLGSGYISGNGFDATYGSWNFQGGGSGLFTFRANDSSAGVAVPDSGNTLVLLGGAFIALGFMASRIQRRKALNSDWILIQWMLDAVKVRGDRVSSFNFRPAVSHRTPSSQSIR